MHSVRPLALLGAAAALASLEPLLRAEVFTVTRIVALYVMSAR